MNRSTKWSSCGLNWLPCNSRWRKSYAAETTATHAAQLSAAVDQIREQQSLEETQIATHEQAKVESESKYPLKLSGLVLLTGFVNTAQTDDPVTPRLLLMARERQALHCGKRCSASMLADPIYSTLEPMPTLRVDFDGASLSGATGTILWRRAHSAAHSPRLIELECG